MQQYFCMYCKDWFDVDACATHFGLAHAQENITFEKLSQRLASLGGIEVRESQEEDSAVKTESFWGWMGGAK